jgi:hypothetical protein
MDSTNNFSIIGRNGLSAWGDDPKRTTGATVVTPNAAGVAALVIEFAVQNDPSDPQTDTILERILIWLKKYEDMGRNSPVCLKRGESTRI